MNILLDLDNTLLDFDRGQYEALNILFTYLGLTPSEDLHQEYDQINKSLWHQIELGKLDIETLKIERFRLFTEALDLEVNLADLARYYESALSQQSFLIEGSIELLERLASDNHLYIASNGIGHIQRPRIKKSGIDKYIDKFYLSEEIGWAKPHPKYFQTIFNDLNQQNPAYYVMIGDSINSDIQGGRDSGIRTIWFNQNQKTNDSEIRADFEVKELSQIPNLIDKIKESR